MALGQAFRALLLCIPLLLPATLGQSDGYFVVPTTPGPSSDYSQNKAYTVGDQVEIKWFTDLNNIALVLWQQNSSADAPSTDLLSNYKSNTNGQNSYMWTVTLDYPSVSFNTKPSSKSPGNVFFLALYNVSSTSFAFDSHYFNITENTTSTATTTATAGPTQTSDPNLTTSSAAPPPVVTPVSDSSSSSSGLSTGAQAGIGVGVAVVCLLAIAGLTWFFINWRRKNRAAQQGAGAPMLMNNGGPPPQQLPSEKQGYPGYSHNGQGSPPQPQYQPPYSEAYKPASGPAELTGQMRAELPPEGNGGEARPELP